MNAWLGYFERRKLASLLLLGFSVGVLVALVIGFNAVSSLQKSQAQMEALYENDLRGLSNMKDATIRLVEMDRAVRQMVIAPDGLSRDAAAAQLKRAREQLVMELEQARQRSTRTDLIARLNQVQTKLTRAFEVIEQATGMLQRENAASSEALRFITSAAFADVITQTEGAMAELTDLKEAAAGEALAQARLLAQQARNTALAGLLLGVVGVGLAGGLVGLAIQRPNVRLRQSVEALVAGATDTPIPHTDYPNEVGVLARAIAVLQGVYRQAGEQQWVKTQVSDIGTAVQQEQDFAALAHTAICRLATAMEAGHGAFYVTREQGVLQLLGSYGYRERKELSNRYRVGEGLVGQCAMEKAPILLRAPQDYIRIQSGLGEAPPACVLVQPILQAGRVLGVIEMASFQVFTEPQRAVLEALLPMLASSMEILDRNLRTQELLTSTQVQAERMEKQAAQLEEQTVEMEAQQAELLETEQWFRAIIEAAPQGMLVADGQSHILLANPAAEAMLGYTAGELVNIPFTRLLPKLSLDGEHTVYSATTAAVCKDGSQRLLDVVCSPLPQRSARGRCVSVSLRVATSAAQAS